MEKWKFNTRDWVISSAAVGADGTIYVGSYNHNLYAFDDGGRVLWKFKTQKFVFSSPTICFDGTLLVGSDDGSLYALKTESAGLVDSPWPKFRSNITNRGRLQEARSVQK
ncbi:MAG: outer membrane protein assembly factor BamB family protein [Planctomycetota bacterium]